MDNPDRRRSLARIGGILIAVAAAAPSGRASAAPAAEVCLGSPCTPVCGDGFLSGSETCDDGNTRNGDGCTAGCQVELGFHCNGSSPSVCATTCGDGVVAAIESCDDGNLRSGDGCSASCAIENAWRCNGAPSQCIFDSDGDGVLDPNDNCVHVSNPAQQDEDRDRTGDACDNDRDGNGFDDTYDVRGGGCDATGAASGIGVGIALAVLAGRRRRRRGGRAIGAGAALLGLAITGAGTARAEPPVEPRNFDVERFHWSAARSAILGAEAGNVIPAGALDLGMWLGSTDDSLVVAGGTSDVPLVSRRTTAALAAAFGIANRLELALAVPIVLAQDRAQSAPGVRGMLAPLSGGLGDILIAPKLAVVRQDTAGFSVAVIAAATLPTGRDDYRGERTMTFVPTAVVSRSWDEFAITGNLGWRMRELAEIADLRVDDELFVEMAAAYQVDPVVGLELGWEGATGARFPFRDNNTNHIEVRGGATFRFDALVIEAIVGTGIEHGWGTPDWRGVLAARYSR